MTLHMLPRRGAVADVQSRLQAQIVAGVYKPDERLPSESELCKAYGVSRPVIREALMGLQGLGLTTSQAGIGTFVVSDKVRVPLLLGRYSAAHVREVRRCIEIPAARLCAERRSASRRWRDCRRTCPHGRRSGSGAAQSVGCEFSHRYRPRLGQPAHCQAGGGPA